jgi:hypothetical protein
MPRRGAYPREDTTLIRGGLPAPGRGAALRERVRKKVERGDVMFLAVVIVCVYILFLWLVFSG